MKNLYEKLKGYISQNREYVLVFCVMLLCLLCGVADRFWLGRTNEFLGTLVFEVVIFVIPLLIYIFTSSKNVTPSKVAREYNISKISHKLIFVPITAALLLISGTLLLEMLFFGIYDITDGFSLFSTFYANGDGSALSHIYMILAFAVIPAVFEEMVFRKILTKRHASDGIFVSVAVSAMFYSLSSMSLRELPVFLFSGIIFCAVFIFTGSLISSIATHMLFNLYGIYLRTNIANYFVSSSDAYVLVVLAIVVFLISAILFCGVLYRIFLNFAKQKATPPTIPEDKRGVAAALGKSFGVFKNPVNIATLAVFAAFVIIFGFFG